VRKRCQLHLCGGEVKAAMDLVAGDELLHFENGKVQTVRVKKLQQKSPKSRAECCRPASNTSTLIINKCCEFSLIRNGKPSPFWIFIISSLFSLYANPAFVNLFLTLPTADEVYRRVNLRRDIHRFHSQ